MFVIIKNKLNYEFSKFKKKNMNYNFNIISENILIKSIDETLDKLLEGNVSMSRFGDGEFGIIDSEGNGFQGKNKKLAKRLSEVLKTYDKENYIVCLPDIWGDMKFWNDKARSGWKYVRSNGKNTTYKILSKKIKKQNIFYNAHVTRLYNDWIDKSECSLWFDKIKKIWDKKDILIVEGEYSKLGVGNDLFDNSKSIERIICPCENAFDKYDDILSTTIKYAQNKLILIALGQTATVLAYDLYKLGFYAIDIGHIDIEYEWFFRKTDVKINISGKYVNEINNNTNDLVSIYNIDKYKNQILKIIL